MTSDGHPLTVALLLFPPRYQRIPFFESLKPHKSFLKHYEIPSHQKTFWFPTLKVSKYIFIWRRKQKSWVPQGQAGPKAWQALSDLLRALRTGHQVSFCSSSHRDPPHTEGWGRGHHPQKKEILKCWEYISFHFIFLIMRYFRHSKTFWR